MHFNFILIPTVFYKFSEYVIIANTTAISADCHHQETIVFNFHTESVNYFINVIISLSIILIEENLEGITWLIFNC